MDAENNHTYTDNIDTKNNDEFSKFSTKSYGTQQLKDEVMENMNEGLDVANDEHLPLLKSSLTKLIE